MREDSLRKSALRLLACYGKGQSHKQITERQLDVQAARAAKLTMGLRHPGMMLLDDPVGTGKTPVSLCVAKLLFDESQIDHALVVTPSAVSYTHLKIEAKSILELCRPPDGYTFVRGAWATHDLDLLTVSEYIAPALVGSEMCIRDSCGTDPSSSQ